MNGALYEAEHLEQLRDADGQNEAGKDGCDHPEGKAVVFHEIRDLVERNIERGGDRCADLRHGAEEQYGLRLHRGRKEEGSVRRLEDVRAAFIGAPDPEHEEGEDHRAGPELQNVHERHFVLRLGCRGDFGLRLFGDIGDRLLQQKADRPADEQAAGKKDGKDKEHLGLE